MADDESIRRTITDLLREVQNARTEIAKGDHARQHALSELRSDVEKGSKSLSEAMAKLDRISAHVTDSVARLQAAHNSLAIKIGRPGVSADVGERSDRAAARGLLELKHLLRVPKFDPEHPFSPAESEIDEAEIAVKAIRHLMKSSAGVESLSPDQRKALTSFNLGASGFIMPPEMSSQILSCLEDKTDLSGLVGKVSISGPSIKFMVDNAELDAAQWACDVDCICTGPGAGEPAATMATVGLTASDVRCHGILGHQLGRRKRKTPTITITLRRHGISWDSIARSASSGLRRLVRT